MAVKYQVERRPIGPDGKVYRGTESLDYVMVFTNYNPVKEKNTSGLPTSGSGLGSGSGVFPHNGDPTKYDASKSTSITSNLIEVNGEPWIVHSTHFAAESALAAAAPLASAIGIENVRIVKVLSHGMEFKLN